MIAITPAVRDLVRLALEEDIGSGDITTELTVLAETRAEGAFFAREAITVAGVELLPLIYEMRGGVDRLAILAPTGTRVPAGQKIAEVEGSARTLLTCERVSLNFLQRLSGIATLASRYTSAVEGTGVRILDTRKTTPGWRALEKAASAAGGVTNHRAGLYDAVLIKNNHIAAAGGVRAALERARGASVPVEIEVRTKAELAEALDCGATRLLLDNLTPDEARQWITDIAGRASVELSGGITLETVRAYAEARPEFISCGAVTHSATAVDLNFRLAYR